MVDLRASMHLRFSDEGTGLSIPQNCTYSLLWLKLVRRTGGDRSGLLETAGNNLSIDTTQLTILLK